MFQKTRLKLTLWYLFIIMLISMSFSVAIYNVLTIELDRVERAQRVKIEFRVPQDITSKSRFPAIDPEVIEETKDRLILILSLINLGILGIAGIGGYFLAGRTLKPIQDMMEEQNRFIADASHELRTPLTSLKSEIEVNLRDKDLTLKESKKVLESNLEEVNNLQYLSDNLIKLTQYKKTNDISFETISIKQTIDESVKKVTHLAKDKKIKIDNKVGDINIEGDRQKLVELFVILLDNAIKYSGKETEVSISSKKVDGLVNIEVKDQGMGIPKEDISHLFERFYRGDKSRNKQVQGYGLGLSIAKQIVEEHSGTIDVQSEVGQGSTFIISLS